MGVEGGVRPGHKEHSIPVQTTGYFFQACGDLCLFIILTERALALYRTTPTRKLIIKCFLPIALSIPSFVLVIIKIIYPNLNTPSAFIAARNCSITLSVFTISSNIGLSAMFLRILMQNRTGALKSIIMENKMQWSVIGMDIVVAIIVGVLRIITFLPITQGGVLNSIAVHGYAVVTLCTFKNYITITRDVTKTILGTQVSVKATQRNPENTALTSGTA
ncbi:hypothetical protein BKA69DRAFT_1170263 [Paraphysoderma sedebokerense]|nr:hypothetical protein BKA69DRAFT_1170263 [Paraphysoderma sedebokerense]